MADSGRADYDRLARFTQLEPGEPWFFIRGRDPNAGPAVRAWAALAAKRGVPAALVESALQQADRLDEWPNKRLPDADHLTPAEQQAFEYQLQRRAWSHRVAHVPTDATLLAEARGAQAAIARERHADALLVDLVEALVPVVEHSSATKDELKRVLAAMRRCAEDLARRHDQALELARQVDQIPPPEDPPAAVLIPFVPGVEEAISVFEAPNG